MLTTLFGALYDGLPLVSLAVAFIWTLRYQKHADLSLAGSFSVSAACTASLMQSGFGPLFSIICGLAIGFLVGLAMGLAINALQIEPLLAGLIILFITYALSLGVTQGTIPISAASNPLTTILIAEDKWGMPGGAHPGINLLFFLIAVFSVFLTSYVLASEWGCAFRALEDLNGGRPLLQSLGISPSRLSLIGFGIAGILSAVSGILVALRDRQTTSSLGLDALVDIIPAYLLGTALFEHRPQLKFSSTTQSVWWGKFIDKIDFHTRWLRSFSPSFSAAIGVLIFFLAVNFVQQITPLPWLPRVLIGIILLTLLGLRPGLAAWSRLQKEKRATHIVETTSPLAIDSLSVIYPTSEGEKTILKDVSLTASPREIIQIKGPNGAGKSTLLKALVGKIESTGNFAIPSAINTLNRSALVAYVPQDADESTASSLSIAEHAVLATCGSKVSPVQRWKRKAANAFQNLAAGDVVADPGALISWLSGGQKRRVVLGLLRLRKPRPIVIALDEPFDDLDVAGRQECAETLRDLASQGHVIVFIDHQSHIKPTRIIADIWDTDNHVTESR